MDVGRFKFCTFDKGVSIKKFHALKYAIKPTVPPLGSPLAGLEAQFVLVNM